MTELTSANFDAFIANGTVLVDFYAPWCGPCRHMEPIVSRVTTALGIPLGKLDVDNASSVASLYGVTSLPTLLLFKQGELKSRNIGAMGEKALADWLRK